MNKIDKKRALAEVVFKMNELIKQNRRELDELSSDLDSKDTQIEVLKTRLALDSNSIGKLSQQINIECDNCKDILNPKIAPALLIASM